LVAGEIAISSFIKPQQLTLMPENNVNAKSSRANLSDWKDICNFYCPV